MHYLKLDLCVHIGNIVANVTFFLTLAVANETELGKNPLSLMTTLVGDHFTVEALPATTLD